jgi:glucose-1-phosphate adenylyltransferase
VEAGSFGIVDADEGMRIRGFAEKPTSPRPHARAPSAALASMGIYVFDTRFLLECLNEDAADVDSRHDFGYSILPRAIAVGQVYAHQYERARARPYWRDAGTIDSFWSAHMDLLGASPRFSLDDPDWPLQGGAPATQRPARLAPEAAVSGALLGWGCQVEGEVVRSVVSSAGRVGARSKVRECVLLPNAEVGRDCVLERVIVDSDCRIPDGSVIDRSLLGGDHAFHVSPGGVTLVTAAALEEARARGQAGARHAISA